MDFILIWFIDMKYAVWVSSITCSTFTGTWFVGNIGHQKGPLKHCLIAAYVLHPTLYVMNDYALWMYAMTLASVMTFDSFSKTWRYTPKQKLSLSRRLLRFSALTLIYCALWSSSIYLKNESHSENQREMRFPEFVWNTLLGVKVRRFVRRKIIRFFFIKYEI